MSLASHAPNDKITRPRVAEYFQLLFAMLVEHGGSMPRKEILAQFPKRMQMTAHELALTKSGLPRWLTTMHMWSIDFQKAGFFGRSNGVWTISDEGRRCFASLDPMAFFDLARKRYAAWRDSQDDAEFEDDEDSGTGGGEDATAAMRRIWLIGTGSDAGQWSRFRKQGVVAIGFTRGGQHVGDLATLSREQIHGRLKAMTGAKNPKNDSRACWEFAHEMREGDLVLARAGASRLLGIGRIAGKYAFDPSVADYAHSRRVEWIDLHERGMPERVLLPTKTLTEMSRYPDLVDVMIGARSAAAESLLESQGHTTASIDGFFTQQPYLIDLLADPAAVQPAVGPSDPDAPPSLESIDSESFATRAELESIMAALATKRAVVLQGSPGTGKTFLAQKLAHHFAGSMDRVHRVQFHPAYSYEDFVRGIRPTATGFAVENGPLVRISEEAKRRPREQFVLFIDEINRGNVAKILGEALSLIEVDKRDPKHRVKLGLAYEGEHDFWIPPNVAVLATMNTADRSIALVDYALRRRFAFMRLPPAFERAEFAEWLLDQLSPSADEASAVTDPSTGVVRAIVEAMRDINAMIVADKAFGDGFAIGHSFFCTFDPRHGESPQRWAARVFEQEIEPLIDEYCIEHPAMRKKLLALIPTL